MRQLFQVEYSIVESFQGTVANLKKERDSEIKLDKVVMMSSEADNTFRRTQTINGQYLEILPMRRYLQYRYKF